MFPNAFTILIFILVAMFIAMVGFLLPKVVGAITEIIFVIATLTYLFIIYSFGEAMMLMSLSSMAYANFGMILNKDKQKMRMESKQKLLKTDYQTISQERDYKRITVDLLLTICVSIGAVVFFIFAPDIYSLLKFFIAFGLIAVLTQMVERIGGFWSTALYWLPNEERLIIISPFQSRDFPINDVKEVKRESAPDILRLHPLFTFLSANKDYTSSFEPVLKLAFPGENIYLTPNELDKWHDFFVGFADDQQEKHVKRVMPLWHPTVLKRLFWKVYFAITVKGVSAYTGLIFILIWLDVPMYVMVGFVIVWWLFNLYVSDRVLVAASDAVELTDGEIHARANVIFNKAGVPNTTLYVIDSPIYNGLATGMNIGRGTVMLTRATMELPIRAVEAILAHEAIHIKKRDVLTNQVARMLFFGLIAVMVYAFYDQIVLLADNLFVFIPLFYILMLLFPMYLSFIGQWTEVRADHFGAKLLEEGRKQMEAGLRALGNAQDQALDKSSEYSMVKEKETRKRMSVERENWFFRIIEFQIQIHPPLYWRIHCLAQPHSWKEARKEWMIARLKESVPDLPNKRERN